MKKNGEQDSLYERSKEQYKKCIALNLNTVSRVGVYCEDVSNYSINAKCVVKCYFSSM